MQNNVIEKPTDEIMDYRTFCDRLGSIIRQLREANDVSQKTLANALEVSQQQIQKYESGTDGVSAYKIAQLSTFFSLSPKFFFEEIFGKQTFKKTEELEGFREVMDVANFLMESTFDAQKMLKSLGAGC